jgi:hypothetical protein
MTIRNLGLYYDEKILVRLKKNSDLSLIEKYNNFDYRCGCDLCGYGHACGLKTNFLKLCNEAGDNWFELNDLAIESKGTWYEDEFSMINFRHMNETTDKDVIEKIYKLHLLFDKLAINDMTVIASCFDDYARSSFEKIKYEEMKNINSIHICGLCCSWFVATEGDQIRNKFENVDPYKYFWSSVVNCDLYDLIEFKDDKQKMLFD